ncbi:MAG: isopeptide-forming domain-containing fimbrial protein [Clostridiales bacterium]|nr:isopeptide-forming domain-containing fimbrial protein [Clostridiales bacterium]
MSKLKKLLGVVLAMVMVLAMSTSALAVTITIDDGDDVSGATYAAYKLMDVTTATTGSGGTSYSYTVNSKYGYILQNAANVSSYEAVITSLEGLQSNSDDLKTFAETVYTAIESANLSADYTTNTGSISGADAGYYLIVETSTGTITGGASDTYSLYMLDTATGTSVTVTTKESVPTLEKKVLELNDSDYSTLTGTWQDAADYDIRDNVPFKLTATISQYFADYDVYTLTFHDTLSTGLTFNADSVKVYVDGTLLDSDDYSLDTTNINSTGGGSFTLTVKDLTSLTTTGITVTATSTVVVTYEAQLNDYAVIGQGSNSNNQGNPNTAYLEYSNNPYDDSDTGTTPEDKVTVFTFKLDVTKYDDANNTLTDAGFTLYKWYATGTNTGSWEEVGSEVYTTGGYTFNWTGLDSGTYKIVETRVPDGYTKADDIVFTVSAKYDTTDDNPELNELTTSFTQGGGSLVSGQSTTNTITGALWAGIYNKSGSLMPSTGGIGTTIFYIVGGVLVVGAVVLLITKRRMGKEQ